MLLFGLLTAVFPVLAPVSAQLHTAGFAALVPVTFWTPVQDVCLHGGLITGLSLVHGGMPGWSRFGHESDWVLPEIASWP